MALLLDMNCSMCTEWEVDRSDAFLNSEEELSLGEHDYVSKKATEITVDCVERS